MDDPTTTNEEMKSLVDASSVSSAAVSSAAVSSSSSAAAAAAIIIVENEHLLFSILDYCDEKTRYNAILLSSKQHQLLTTDNSFLWRLQNLHRERGVYHPLVLPTTTTTTTTTKTSTKTSTTTTWKDIFLNNLKRKDLWQPDQSQSKEEGDNSTSNDEEDSNNNNNNANDTHKSNDTFHIQVSARFKPRDKRYVGKFNPHEKKIALPLYQRLALIQMNRDLKSKKEAFQVLYEQGGWFGKEKKQAEEEMIGGNNDNGDDNGDGDDNDNGDDNKNNNKNNNDGEGRDDETGEKTTDKSEEEEEQDPAKAPPSLRGGVHMIDTDDKFAILVDPTKGLRKFSFDNVIDEHSTQESVYKATTMALIAEFINGFNVSCIVYGQTGSGKTHTMYGDNSFHLQNDNIPSSWGIVPRSCHEIFKAIEYRKKHLNLQMKVEIAVSYIEIYGDTVTDLLRKGKSCGRSKVAAQRYVLDGSSDVVASSMADTLTLLEEGESQKRKAATAMNERSSRAHSIFIVRMKQTCIDTDVTSTSRLFLADLGGSEQLKKSQPFVKNHGDGKNSSNTKEQIEYDRKQRAREAVNINLGLLALKQCVEALRRKSSFVPYSDSKLTMMLSTGLGGDSKTAVVVCGAQEQRHGTETIAAMKFGQTCRGISNKVVTTSTNMLQELLQTINDRIMECEDNIKKYERWEERAIEHHLDNGEVEIRKVTEVVGAEEYREQLTNLIRQKMELTGDTTDSLYADSSAIEGFGNAHKYGLGKRVVVNNHRSDRDSCAQS